MKKVFLFISILVLTASVARHSYAQENNVRIKITINGETTTAKMEDNPAAKEFISLLPLSLTLDDYSQTEKVSDLPKKLTKRDAPAAMTPKAGDITFYALWGNLAIFYRDGHHSPGLIKLGTIDSNANAFNKPGSLKVRIEELK